MTYRYLSYRFTASMPVYGGTAPMGIEQTKSIVSGNSTNEYRLTLSNHWGTHVDAPYHFFPDGEKVADYPARQWIFTQPVAVSVSLGPSEILERGAWLEAVPASSDIILIKSGWSARRLEERYASENPGISPEVARSIRERLPEVRAIGIDWISISAYRNREMGRLAHRAFLDPHGAGKPVLLIEDMDLTGHLAGLKEVYATPLLVEGIDSAPCTVVGAFI